MSSAPRSIAESPFSREERDPKVLLVVPRGEAVCNFLYPDTLPTLAASARVSVPSVGEDEKLLAGVREHVEEIIPLRHHPPAPWVSRLRVLVENAHDRWLWSEVAKNNWELRDRRAAEQGKRLQRAPVKASARALALRPALRALTRIEQRASLRSSTLLTPFASRVKVYRWGRATSFLWRRLSSSIGSRH